MSLVRKFYSFFLLAFLIILLGCNDSNPFSPLSSDDYDVSIEISDENNLSGNVKITNRTDFKWNQIDLEIVFEEINSDKKYTQTFEFGELEKNYRKNAAFITSIEVQHPLCYTYYLSIIPKGYNEKITDEGGTCS